MFAVNGILFNHESERRGENFVTRKITLAAGRIAEGLQDHLELGNMDSLRDWGYAKDYVECMWMILQHDTPEDFVIATGEQHTVRDFTEKAFAANGITIRWEGEGIDGTDYISVMPTNLYGPNDNYHPTHSHVLPALIRRFHEAKVNGLKEVTCWGDGSPLREFLYVDDLANLCVFLMNNYSGDETVNAGTGKELTIKELTELVAKVIGYEGEIKWDSSKPNGTPRKLLDVSKATNLGWTYKTELEEGIRLSYEDFLNNPMRAER